MPPTGTNAPDFTLPDQDGTPHSLSDYAGRFVLIYFYPKDDTPGCTKEACAIRDAFPNFSSLDAVVLGISPDSVASHKKFVEKYGLPFTLLADENKEAVNAYGVWGRKSLVGDHNPLGAERLTDSEVPDKAREYDGVFRTSFLVAPDGTIVRVYENVKPETHAATVLGDLESLKADV